MVHLYLAHLAHLVHLYLGRLMDHVLHVLQVLLRIRLLLLLVLNACQVVCFVYLEAHHSRSQDLLTHLCLSLSINFQRIEFFPLHLDPLIQFLQLFIPWLQQKPPSLHQVITTVQPLVLEDSALIVSKVSRQVLRK